MPKGVYIRTPIEKRFAVRIEKTPGCWLWLGFIGHNGYGQITNSGKTAMAHRVAYELIHGAIPEGLHVRHKCNNRICVNPDHLSLGSHAENMRDRKESGRYGGRYCGAKLNEQIVAEIRNSYVSGVASHRELAKEYGISKTQVGHIVRGEQWRIA